MAKGKGLILLALGAMMMGGKKSTGLQTGELPLPGGGGAPGGGGQPLPGEDPAPEEPLPGEEPIAPLDVQVINVIQPIPTGPFGPIGPIFPGPEQPIPEPIDVTAIQVFNSLIKGTPQPNAAYKIKQGDTLLGSGGIAAQAILAGSGQVATPAERYAYYEAITRVRTNWMLYATTAANNPVNVTDENNDTVAGTVTASFFKMHDTWPGSMQEDDMPARLIGFSRNQNLQPVPLGNWTERAHGTAKSTRQFGTLWLPDLACVDFGPDVFTNEQCDWPPALWEAVGIDRWDWGAE